jgi:hypothetical protein
MPGGGRGGSDSESACLAGPESLRLSLRTRCQCAAPGAGADSGPPARHFCPGPQGASGPGPAWGLPCRAAGPPNLKAQPEAPAPLRRLGLGNLRRPGPAPRRPCRGRPQPRAGAAAACGSLTVALPLAAPPAVTRSQLAAAAALSRAGASAGEPAIIVIQVVLRPAPVRPAGTGIFTVKSESRVLSRPGRDEPVRGGPIHSAASRVVCQARAGPLGRESFIQAGACPQPSHCGRDVSQCQCPQRPVGPGEPVAFAVRSESGRVRPGRAVPVHRCDSARRG